jgi:hypothetical protein
MLELLDCIAPVTIVFVEGQIKSHHTSFCVLKSKEVGTRAIISLAAFRTLLFGYSVAT